MNAEFTGYEEPHALPSPRNFALFTTGLDVDIACSAHSVGKQHVELNIQIERRTKVLDQRDSADNSGCNYRR
jgi:hypothetical protein